MSWILKTLIHRFDIEVINTETFEYEENKLQIIKTHDFLYKYQTRKKYGKNRIFQKRYYECKKCASLIGLEFNNANLLTIMSCEAQIMRNVLQ